MRISLIRQDRQKKIISREPMKNINPQLKPIEDIFNPKTKQELSAGLFIHRNLNIATFYNKYKEERKSIIRKVHFQHQLESQDRRLKLEMKKKHEVEEDLKRWDYRRKERNQQIDAYVAEARKQKFMMFWVEMALVKKAILIINE